MQILINTANHMRSSADFEQRLSAEIESSFERHAERITRVEVHLSDENSDKQGSNDKRCMIEVKMAGLAPLATTNKADDFNLAFYGAMEKAITAVEHKLGKMDSSHVSAKRLAQEFEPIPQ